MRRILFFLLVATSLTAAAQQAVHIEPQLYITAIDVVADVRDASGNVPRGLTPEDFVLLEDGVERRIIAVDYLREEPSAAPPLDAAELSATVLAQALPPPEWQVVIYFESMLSNGTSRKRAAEALLLKVDHLVRMGRVDVVFASPTPKALVRNSRDPEAIGDALRKIAAYPGLNLLMAHRREFYREAQAMAGLEAVRAQGGQASVLVGPGTPSQSQPNFDASFADSPATFDAAVIRPYIDTELHLVAQFRAGLLSWLKSYRRHVPRVLLMITDGFDVNPLDFYIANLSKTDQITLRSYVAQTGLSELTQSIADGLAGAAWSTVSIPATNDADGWVDDTSYSAIGRAQDVSRRSTLPKAILFSPLEPLHEIAQATGGRVVPNYQKMAEVIDGLDDRLKLTYQVQRKPDGIPRKIELRARKATLTVRAARWAASSTATEIAETRALGLLGTDSRTGDLPLESSVDWKQGPGRRSGTLRAKASLDLVNKVLAPGVRGEFRFTLAVHVPPNQAFVVNRVVSDYDVSTGVFQLRTPIDLPANASQMVVVVEEIATGLWGSTGVRVRQP